jgi:transcriptional antiterminator NusG
MAEEIEHVEMSEALPEEPEAFEVSRTASDAPAHGADRGEESAPVDEASGEDSASAEMPAAEGPGDEAPGDEVPGAETAGDENRAEEIPGEAEPGAEIEVGEPVAQTEGETEGETETPAPAPASEAEADNKKWYIIHTYSGFEGKVADSLRSRAQAFGFAEKIGSVLIPTEEVVEMRAGRKVISKRLLYPGYVLVEMAMDDQLWHEVKNTPRVTGFVGGGNNPVPLTADEVNSILYRQASSAERPRPKQTFEKNETVRIIDGPFASFSGKVDEINTERDTLRVMVTIFGRSTPVELEFTQVEKIS